MSLVTQMSNVDLLSAVIGAGADTLLHKSQGSLYQLLYDASSIDHRVEDSAPLEAWSAARFRLDSARELVRRALEEDLCREAIASPGAARDYLLAALSALQHEVFMVLFLDGQNRLIASRECFRGTVSQTSVYPREIVKLALEYNATSVIFAHNHPSGIAEPSHADKLLTTSLRQALALVDIRVMDHLIVGCGKTYSMAEHGLM